MFIEDLLFRLEEASGRGIDIYSKETSAEIRTIVRIEGAYVLPENGRAMIYRDRLFYLSVESLAEPEGDIKEAADSKERPAERFRKFLKSTILKLFAVDHTDWRVVPISNEISLVRFAPLKEETIDAEEVIRFIISLLRNYLMSSSGSYLPGANFAEFELSDAAMPEERVLGMIIEKPVEQRCYSTIPAEKESSPFQAYPVLYGTNRKKNNSGKEGEGGFGEEREDKLSVGACKVSIPKTHRQGELERPGWFRRLFFGDSPAKHFTLLENEVVDSDRFIELLKERFEDSGENDVLLFIHGFNTKFDDALYRTAQLGYDLCFKGAVTAFSWPSRGRVLDYVSDVQSAEYSIPFLSEYIELILSSSQIGKLHIIAHSMGNLVLCRALKELNSKGIYPTPVINRVILAAPDIDRDVFFMQIMPAIKTTPNITLYACDKDNALKVSKGLRSGYVRLGEGGDNLLITEGLDSVDASEVEMTTLGHTYFAQTPSLLNEIHMVLQNLPPGARMLQERINDKQQKYWALKRT